MATITVFLQFPAFLSSCGRPENGAGTRIGKQIYIQWAKNPTTKALDVFFFDTLGAQKLDAYQQFSSFESDSPLYALSGSGARHMVALSAREGQLDRWMGIATYGDLCKHSFTLEEENPAAPLLAGEMLLDAGASRRVYLTLRPSLAAVRIRSVSCDFSERPYAGQLFLNQRLFLIYAGAECHPLGPGDGFPVSWLNPGLLDSASVLRLPRPEMVLQEGCGAIGPERICPDRSFYCYPHPQTQLVLEGWVGPWHCYYSIPLRQMRPGEMLELDIGLRRLGSANPDIPTESGAVALETQLVPWAEHPYTTIQF